MVKSFLHQASWGQLVWVWPPLAASLLLCSPHLHLGTPPSSMAEPGLSRSFPQGPRCTQTKTDDRVLSAGPGCSSHPILGAHPLQGQPLLTAQSELACGEGSWAPLALSDLEYRSL